MVNNRKTSTRRVVHRDIKPANRKALAKSETPPRRATSSPRCAAWSGTPAAR